MGSNSSAPLTQQLTSLFSMPPASFAWAQNAQGRTLGSSEGLVLDIWPDRAECVAIFPPDNAQLAARNAILIQLLLSAMRPEWADPGRWLAEQLRQAKRFKPTKNVPIFDVTSTVYRVRLTWDMQASQLTVRVPQ